MLKIETLVFHFLIHTSQNNLKESVTLVYKARINKPVCKNGDKFCQRSSSRYHIKKTGKIPQPMSQPPPYLHRPYLQPTWEIQWGSHKNLCIELYFAHIYLDFKRLEKSHDRDSLGIICVFFTVETMGVGHLIGPTWPKQSWRKARDGMT